MVIQTLFKGKKGGILTLFIVVRRPLRPAPNTPNYFFPRHKDKQGATMRVQMLLQGSNLRFKRLLHDRWYKYPFVVIFWQGCELELLVIERGSIISMTIKKPHEVALTRRKRTRLNVPIR